ncbi:hypothetical protein FB446DRAFT_280320 [Lentinula raphanica]|nr:hypothetical protein FB446DRAFT_280320 [Lentinula raphanica]
MLSHLSLCHFFTSSLSSHLLYSIKISVICVKFFPHSLYSLYLAFSIFSFRIPLLLLLLFPRPPNIHFLLICRGIHQNNYQTEYELTLFGLFILSHRDIQTNTRKTRSSLLWWVDRAREGRPILIWVLTMDRIQHQHQYQHRRRVRWHSNSSINQDQDQDQDSSHRRTLNPSCRHSHILVAVLWHLLIRLRAGRPRPKVRRVWDVMPHRRQSGGGDLWVRVRFVTPVGWCMQNSSKNGIANGHEQTGTEEPTAATVLQAGKETAVVAEVVTLSLERVRKMNQRMGMVLERQADEVHFWFKFFEETKVENNMRHYLFKLSLPSTTTYSVLCCS